MKTEWIKTSERLPERQPNVSYSQVPCLVVKLYNWSRGGKTGVYRKVEILLFNHEHKCWDDADGDDWNCGILQVEFWMPLPEPPNP